MEFLSTFTDIFVIGVLGRAVLTDVRSRRIGNRLTGTATAVGVMTHAVAGGWAAIPASLIGMTVGAAIMLLPYLSGGIGAGDLKLLAAIGALKGAPFVVLAAICTGLAGGALALFYLVRRRGLAGTMYWFGSALTGRAERTRGGRMPYAPAIAAGGLLALLFRR